MKGIAANLGLQYLFNKASEVTEYLRAGDADSAKTALPELTAEYERCCKLIAELN